MQVIQSSTVGMDCFVGNVTSYFLLHSFCETNIQKLHSCNRFRSAQEEVRFLVERPWQNFYNSGIRDQHMINSDVIHPLVFNTQSCDSKPRHVLAGWSMSTRSHVQVRSWRRRTAPRMWLGTALIPWTYEPNWNPSMRLLAIVSYPLYLVVYYFT